MIPGTIWFGPEGDVEQHRYHSYGAYWGEVEALENHQRWVRERLAEAADAPRSQRTELRLRAERAQVEYARFVESIPLAAIAYDRLAAAQVRIEGFGGPDQYEPLEAHRLARKGRKKA